MLMKKLTSLLLMCIFAFTANAQVYVKPAAEGGADTNDGNSWATAKATVAGAIAVVQQSAKKEIWVKKGTYGEVWGTALNLANVGGVSIYGGFNGDETTVEARVKGTNPWDYTNETVMTFTNETGFSIQMNNNLNADNPFVIDGFSFKNMNNKTAGSIQLRAYATMQNCIISDNQLTTGFLNSYAGAAGTVAYRNCLISNNTITGNNVLTHNTNHAELVGIVDGCVFANNTSTSHQIINFAGKGSVSVTNSKFYNNNAAGNILNMGAAIRNEVVNCLIYNNEATAMASMAGAGEVTIINSTIVNNKGKAANGGVSLVSVNAKVYNTIVRGNQTADGAAIGIYGNVTAEVKNCAIDQALPEAVKPANNQLYYPEISGFVAPSAFVGVNAGKTSELAAANWQLTNQPHAMINAGDNTFLAAVYNQDLAGNTRIQNDKIDLGAYESSYNAPALPVLTITPGENGNVTSTEMNGSYFMGQGVKITATPANGYKVNGWKDQNGTVLSTEKDFTFVMPEIATTLTATFVQATERQLTIKAGENGTASVDKSGNYYADQTIELTATPNTDYKFAYWSDADGNIISTEANFKYTMPDKNMALTANFKYKLTRYLISEKNEMDGGEVLEKMKWTRTAQLGETIIDLNDAKYNVSFNDFITNNMWPVPLSEGDEVWLLGDYYTINETLMFSTPGVTWYGGFAGTETSVDQRVRVDLDQNGIIEPWEFEYLTVFDGQMQTIQIKKTVLRIDQGITVDGIVVQGGLQGAVDYGAGVSVGINDAAALPSLLRNSIVRNNLVSGSGTASAYSCGAVAEYNSTIEYCLIEENVMDETNAGPTYAAGISAPRPTSVIANCVIRNNKNLGTSGGNNHGGGAKVGNGKIINCVVYNNTAQRGAGVYVDTKPTATIEYCTIVNNKSENYKGEGDTSASGGGVYFRAKEGGTMQNSIVWNNEAPDAARANIYIEGDGRTGQQVLLGAIAYNGGSELSNGTDNYYTGIDGSDGKISNLPESDVFQKASTVIGYNESMVWDCDWLPKFEGLKVAVKLQEGDEYDIQNFKRSTPSALGAYEFNSQWGVGITNQEKQQEVSVYCSSNELFVKNESPVAVEVYAISGMKVTMSAPAVNHTIPLSKGMYIVVVKDDSTRIVKKVMMY